MNDEMANRIAQGIFTAAILTLVVTVIAYFDNRRKKRNKSNEAPIKAESDVDLIRSFLRSYFSEPVPNKGIRRLISVSGILLPLFISIITYFNSERTYYREDSSFGSFIISFFLYWILYFVVIWIYKGFQESKKQNL